MKRKNSKYSWKGVAVIITALVAVLQLTACSLALVDEMPKKDAFCGAFLVFQGKDQTTRDAFAESYTVNRKGELIQSEKKAIEGVYHNDTVKFEGINGYFIGFMKESNNDDKGIGIIADNGFTDILTQVKVLEKGNENGGEGTFLVPLGAADSFRVYPVYRRVDGSFYLSMDNNQGIHFGEGTEDSEYTMTIDSSLLENMNKQIIKTDKTTIKVIIKQVDPVRKLILKEMNEKDEVIVTTEIKNTNEEKILYKVMSQTSYILVEETLTNKEKGEYIKRSVFSFGKVKDFTFRCNMPNNQDSIGLLTLELSK